MNIADYIFKKMISGSISEVKFNVAVGKDGDRMQKVEYREAVTGDVVTYEFAEGESFKAFDSQIFSDANVLDSEMLKEIADKFSKF